MENRQGSEPLWQQGNRVSFRVAFQSGKVTGLNPGRCSRIHVEGTLSLPRFSVLFCKVLNDRLRKVSGCGLTVLHKRSDLCCETRGAAVLCSTVAVLWILSPAAQAMALPLAGQVVNCHGSHGINLPEELLTDCWSRFKN